MPLKSAPSAQPSTRTVRNHLHSLFLPRNPSSLKASNWSIRVNPGYKSDRKLS